MANLARSLSASTTLLVAASILMAGCGGPVTTEPESAGESSRTEQGFHEVMAALKGLDGQERIEKLTTLAQKEGVVQVYSTMNSMPKIAVAFTDKYDIQVKTYDAGSGDIRKRVVEEARAGKVVADVVENNGPEMFALNQKNLLVPYESTHEKELTESANQKGWIGLRINYFVASWNSNLVSPEEAPSSYEDLAKSKWRGRLAMEVSDVDWYWAVRNYLVDDRGWPEGRAEQLFADMAAHSSVVDGHSTGRQLVEAGEYAVFASDLRHSVAGDIAEGAPIAWEPPIEPMFGRPNGAGLVKNAPHPAAAILMLEFLTSKPAQQILAEDKYDVVNANLANQGWRKKPYDTRIIDIEEYMQHRRAAEREYAKLLEGRDR